MTQTNHMFLNTYDCIFFVQNGANFFQIMREKVSVFSWKHSTVNLEIAIRNLATFFRSENDYYAMSSACMGIYTR